MISLGLGAIRAEKRLYIKPDVALALAETAAWCFRGSLRVEDLRSPMLDPSAVLNVDSFDELGIHAWVAAKRRSYRQAVEHVIRKRSDELRRADSTFIETIAAQSEGRMLLYKPMETVADGAAAVSSRGFFDVEDAPPWDTWFWYVGGTIFSWVPNELVSVVQEGLDANPVDCIRWTEWSRLPTLLSRS